MVKTAAPNAGRMGSVSGRGTEIPHAVWHGQKIFKNKIRSFKKKNCGLRQERNPVAWVPAGITGPGTRRPGVFAE